MSDPNCEGCSRLAALKSERWTEEGWKPIRCGKCEPSETDLLKAEIERLRGVVASHHALGRSSVGPAATARETAIAECVSFVRDRLLMTNTADEIEAHFREGRS